MSVPGDRATSDSSQGVGVDAADALPSGVITLMFTDIEGSTQHWEQHPRAFRGSLDRHNEIVREVVERWDGHEVKSQGDSFMLAFERTTSAIYCALDIQQELAKADWSEETGQPQVRIGLHTGEPFRGYDATGRPDYFGPMVNRAARIADAGHGGQILLSGSTSVVAQGAISTGVEMVDLGYHRLKGLEQPEQIFELRQNASDDDEPHRFPPLRTQAALHSNLPIVATSFVGRNLELPEFCEVLAQPDTRLLTIIGFGGMGKTRLALQVAEMTSRTFADGTRWIELEEARSSDVMVARIAFKVGLHIQPEPSVREQLLKYLQSRKLLLVLDNVEQVPDAATVISDLLRGAPEIKCLVTSRRALGLQAERVKEVLPLPTTDAVSLFVDRASTLTHFELTEDNAADVTELCRRAEGIPLAIELAASRVTTLSPREIARRLDERFQVLQSDAPDLPPRQRALRAAIDWSFSLLSPADQKLFARLAIFSGGWTLADAEAICQNVSDNASGEPIQVLEGIARLRNHSLLRSEIVPQTQQTRYFMLESLRDYAQEKLMPKPTEAMAVAERHVEYFLDFAQQRVALLRSGDAAHAIAEMEGAYQNVRAAMEWSQTHQRYVPCVQLCLAMGVFLQCRGFGHEALRRLDTGMSCLRKIQNDPSSSTSPQEVSRLKADLLREIASVHLDHFRWEKARSEAVEAQRYFEEIGDEAGVASAINLQGLVDKAENIYDSARVHFSRALELFQQKDDRLGQALELNNLGLLEYSDANGNRTLAEQYWQQALEIHRELDDQRGVARVVTNLGALAQERGDIDDAWTYSLEALRWERELHNSFGVGRALSNLGEVAELRNDRPRACRLYAAARCLFNQVGSPYEKYTSELLERLERDGSPEEMNLNELREKNLNELVTWALGA